MSDHDRARLPGTGPARGGQSPSWPTRNVIAFYDLVEEAGHPWVGWRGQTSRAGRRDPRRGALPLQRIATLSLAILGALEAAHRAGITHRDVKPSNILLTDDGRVSSPTSHRPDRRRLPHYRAAGMLVGSPSYIPPEVIQGRPRRATGRHVGLGATLYAAGGGSRAVRRRRPDATLHAVVSDPTRPPIGPGRSPRSSMACCARIRAAASIRSRPSHLLDALRRVRPGARGSGGGPVTGLRAASAELPLDNGGSGAPATAPPRSTATGCAGERHPERHRGRPARRRPLPTPDPALNDASRSLLRIHRPRPNTIRWISTRRISIRPSSRNTPPNGHPNSVPYPGRAAFLRSGNGILRIP